MSVPSDTLWVGDLPAGIDEATVKSVFAVYGSVVRVKVLPVSSATNKGAAIIQLATVQEAKWLVDNGNGNMVQGLADPIVVRFAKTPGSQGQQPQQPQSWQGQQSQAWQSQPQAWQGQQSQAWPPPPPPPSRGGHSSGSYGKAPAGGKWDSGAGSQPYGGKGASKKGCGDKSFSFNDMLKGFEQNGVFPNIERSAVTQLYISGLPPDTTDLDLYKLFCPFGCQIKSNGVKAMLGKDGKCTGTGFVDICDAVAAEMARQAINGTAMPSGLILKVQPKRQKKPTS